MAERFDLEFCNDVDGVLEFVLERGLLVREMGTAQYEGGRHWHISRPGEKGVLELTWAPSLGEMWIEVRGNRRGDWVMEVVRMIRCKFGRRN
ncbi:MAG: hypothetical protein ACKVQS_02015 [Fimbriimonadaceae bacterium]